MTQFADTVPTQFEHSIDPFAFAVKTVSNDIVDSFGHIRLAVGQMPQIKIDPIATYFSRSGVARPLFSLNVQSTLKI